VKVFLSSTWCDVEDSAQKFETSKPEIRFDFCLTVHHQLGKVIQMNQLDATMIY